MISEAATTSQIEGELLSRQDLMSSIKNNLGLNAIPETVKDKKAIAHLYFESIHPFEDGNGCIGRAIAEKCLSQSLGKPVFLSLSSVIEKSKSSITLP